MLAEDDIGRCTKGCCRDLHRACFKRRRCHDDDSVERCRRYRQGTDSGGRGLAGLHHGPRWHSLLSLRVRQAAFAPLATVNLRYFRRSGGCRAAALPPLDRDARRGSADRMRSHSIRNTKIIYFCRQTAYPAQKGGGSGAVSDPRFHRSGLRGPELDAYRGWPDRRLYFVRLEDPRSDLTMVKSGTPGNGNRPIPRARDCRR